MLKKENNFILKMNSIQSRIKVKVKNPMRKKTYF